MLRVFQIICFCFVSFVFFGKNELVFAQARSSFIGKVLANRVALRSGPNVNFETLAVLDKDKTVIVLSSEYGWSKVKLPFEVKVYVKEEYLKLISNDIAEVLAGRLNVRCLPSDKSTAVGKLERGRRIYVMDVHDGWRLIKPVDELFGWIKEDLLAAVPGAVVPDRLYLDPPIDVLPSKRKEVTVDIRNQAMVDVVGVIERSGSEYVLKQDSDERLGLTGPDAVLSGFIGRRVKVTGKDASLPKNGGILRVITVSGIQLVFQ